MNIVIDNYDSFTYNLVQYIGELDPYLEVYKNNEISIIEIEKLNPDHIIISPGPGRPEFSGISKDIIKNLKNKIPILGICLGHQAIGLMGGATVPQNSFLDLMTALSVLPLAAFTTLAVLGGANKGLPQWLKVDDDWIRPDKPEPIPEVRDLLDEW